MSTAEWTNADTAISRKKPSRPARFFSSYIKPTWSILDYGCGRGFDVHHFVHQGHHAIGFDPLHRPDIPTGKFDLVTLFFVLNVIPSIEDRLDVIRHCVQHARERVFIAVRSRQEIEQYADRWCPYNDGFITGKGSFQRGFTASELTLFLEPFGHVEIVKTTEWIGAILSSAP